MKKFILIIALIAGTSRLYAGPAKDQQADKVTQDRTWRGEPVEGFNWVLVYSPMAMLILGVLFINLGTKNFKLEDALEENEYPRVTQANPLFTSDELAKIQASPALINLLTPTIDVSYTEKGLPKSSSRYLALITTTLSLAIAACLTSLFIYMYIRTGTQPDVNHMGDVLVALGIGVTPYAFNKVATAVAAKK